MTSQLACSKSKSIPTTALNRESNQTGWKKQTWSEKQTWSDFKPHMVWICV